MAYDRSSYVIRDWGLTALLDAVGDRQKQKRGWLRKELPRKFKTHVSTFDSMSDFASRFKGNLLSIPAALID